MKRFIAVSLSCIICSMLTFGTSHSPTREIPKELLPGNGISIKEVTQGYGIEDMGKGNNSVYCAHRNNSPKKTAEDKPMVKVTATFPTLGEEWTFNSFIVYDHVGTLYTINVEKEYDDNGMPIPINKWEFEIQEGLYDCMAVFYRINNDCYFGEEAPVYYIVENIEVKDGTIFELKPQDSVICLNMQPTIPNGESCRFMKADWLEDGSFNILDEGNIEEACIEKMVFFRGEHIYTLTNRPWSVDLVPGAFGTNNPYTYLNVYVNSVSDKYLFRNVCIMNPADNQDPGVYVAVTEAKGAVEGKYTNGKYALDFHEIVNTSMAEQYPMIDNEYTPTYPYNSTFYAPEYSTIGWAISFNSANIWRIWNSGPENPLNEGDLYYSYKRSLADVYDFTNDLTYYIEGTRIYPFAPDGNNLTYFPSYPLYTVPDYALPEDCFYPGDKGFFANFSNCDICEGGTAPLLTSCVTNTLDWELSENFKTFDFYYTGRLGEWIGSDIFLSLSTFVISKFKFPNFRQC